MAFITLPQTMDLFRTICASIKLNINEVLVYRYYIMALSQIYLFLTAFYLEELCDRLKI